jgi:hypothetical protein
MRLPDGRYVVANSGASDVRYYDAEGLHLATVGRQGEGPGEFRSVNSLIRGPADSLIVYDNQARRFSMISPEAAFVRDFRFAEADGVSMVIGRTPSGEYVSLPTGIRGSPGELPNGLVRSDQVVTLHSAEGAIIDTIGTFPGPERVINVQQQGGQIVSVSVAAPPFARTPTFVLSNGALWVATEDGPEFARYALDGTLQLLLRTGREPVPVTSEHVNAIIERRLESAPPQAHAGIRTGYESMPRAELIPPYSRIMTDSAGNLWVEDYENPLVAPGRWTVYAEDGGILARIVLPERFRPFDIGDDWILGRELDDLDVEHLRVYRIVH